MDAFLRACAVLLAYYLVVLLVMPVGLRALPGVPLEIVRKAQHLGYGGSIWLLVSRFDRWWLALLAAGLLVFIAYPVLLFVERWEHIDTWSTARNPRTSELRQSMLRIQLAFAVNLAAFWGIGGSDGKVVAMAGVMAWTLGDEAAALVGKRWGRRPLRGPGVEPGKTLEGSLAMAIFAAAGVFVTLTIFGGTSLPIRIVLAGGAGLLAAVVEALSRAGTDTLTVPFLTSLGVALGWVLLGGLGT